MSTELTPAAPLINLLAFVILVGAMLAAARWLDRRIGRGDYTPLPLSGEARTFFAEPGVGRLELPRPLAKLFPSLARPTTAARSSLAIDERRAILTLLGAALAVGVLFLEQFPGAIAPGELSALGGALQILSGQGPGPFGFDDAGQPAIGGYLIALAWQLFGSGLAVERAIVGLASAVAVVPLYALLRRIVAPLPAVLAASLFLASQTVLLAARGGWPSGILLTGTTFGAWALLRAVERCRPRDWALWGLSLGLLCSIYPFGRLMAIGLALALPYALRVVPANSIGGADGDSDGASSREMFPRRWRRVAGLPVPSARGVALAGLVCLLVLLPQLVPAARDFGQALATAASGGALPSRLWQGVRDALLPGTAATLSADLAGGRWPDPFSLLFAFGGIVVTIRQRRRVALWWALLIVPLVLLLVVGNDAARSGAALVMAVPLAAFVAIAFDAILGRPAFLTRTAQLATLGWIVILAVLNVGSFMAWAASDAGAAARQPALAVSEFWLWRDYQRSRLELQEGLLSLRDYRDLPSETIIGRVASSRDANAEVVAPQRTPPRNDLGTEVRAFGTAGTGPGQFGEPRALAIDAAGNYYVADAGRSVVVKFDSAGAFVAEWPTAGQIARPWAIVTLPDGTLLVLDAETSQLARYDAAGASLGAVQPLGEPAIARGMALGGNGQLYIAQTAANRIVTLPIGMLTNAAAKIVTPAGSAGYQQPTNVVVNARGISYVYEPDSKRLRGFTPDGRSRFTREAPKTDTLDAGGLVLLPDGRVALASVVERKVLIYADDGELLGSFPVAGIPQSLAVTPGGQIAVVDREGGKIRLYQLAVR